MATSRKRTVEIDVVVDDKAASQKLKGVGDDAQKSAKGFSSMSTGMKTAAVAAGAFVATNVVSFMGDAVTNALADAKAQEQLSLAVKNTTDATALEVDAVADYIDKTQQATGITDDELRPAFANLVRATKDVTEAEDLMGVAMDIATARGLPLEAVTLGIAKAAQGNVGALGRMGINVRDAAGDFLTFEEAIEAARGTFAGATEAMANSAEGKMKRLSIAFDEAKEGVGMFLLPILEDVAEAMLQLKEDLATPGNQGFVDSVITGFKDLEGEGQGFTHWMQGVDASMSVFEDDATRWADLTLPHLAEGMDIARHSAEKHTGATDTLTGATGEAIDAEEGLTEAVQGTVDIRQEAFDQLRGQMDTFWGLVDATEKQAEAQAVVNDLEARGLENTPTYTEAVRELAETTLGVEEAQYRLLTAGGLTREEFEKQRVKLGLTAEQAQVLIDKYDIIFTPQSVTHTINYHETGRVTGRAGTETDVSGHLHSGGHVPGVPGSEVPMMLRAGEFVSQGGRDPHGNGNGAPLMVQVNVDGKRFIEELVVPQLARYSRRNGGLGL